MSAVAHEWKDKGNYHFKVGNYSSAIASYTRAIDASKTSDIDDPELTKVLYSNRSAAYVKNNQPQQALEDAEEALLIDPMWGKAYGRKGKALFDLKKYQESLETYEEGLALDKTNGTLRAGIDECREALKNNVVAKKEEDEEDDPLASFMEDISELTKATGEGAEVKNPALQESETKSVEEEKEEQPKKKFNVDHDADTADWTKENQIERLLQHRYKWLNLNPYFCLGLPTIATEEDIKRRYKKLNLLVHPDKNSHPLAAEAFEQVKQAYNKLKDKEQRENILNLINQTIERVTKTRKRLLKKKGVIEADIIAKDGSLEEAIDKEIKKEFASRELKRLKSDIHKREFNNRELEKQREEAQYWQEVKETEVYMRETREERVGKWVDFNRKKKRKHDMRVHLEANKRREVELKGHKGVGLDESYKANWR